MIIEIPLQDGLRLKISSGESQSTSFATSRIQKGLLLSYEGEDLSEEAVGFGVPVIKLGLQAIFPSAVELLQPDNASSVDLIARYKLYLEEKLSRRRDGVIQNRWLYTVKNNLAAIIRGVPPLRRLLTSTSSLLRSSLDWQTTYEPGGFTALVTLHYSIQPASGIVNVELVKVEPVSTQLTEIIIMNEQGAGHFDQYVDSSGASRIGDKIGCWDEVLSPSASFTDRRHHISFSLPQVPGARLFHGRERIDSRLAWSGFGYTFPPSLEHFSYQLTIIRKLL